MTATPGVGDDMREKDSDERLVAQIMDALDSLYVTGNQVLGKLHARDEIFDFVSAAYKQGFIAGGISALKEEK